MRRRSVCGVVAAGLLLAAVPEAAVASGTSAGPTASRSAGAAAGAPLELPQAKGCEGSAGIDSGVAFSSTEFTDLGGFSAIADDFRCSGSRRARTLKKLTWVGQYFGAGGTADSFNVRVYRNDTSGSIHEPFTPARNTFGPQVTQKRAWMHFLPS